MAPKIVDRNKKRLEIIEKTFFYLLENGLSNFSLDSLLKYINISKGNFYHYFKSKDELVHCLMHELTLGFIHSCELKLKNAKNLEEKFEILFEVYLISKKENKDFLRLYKEFLLIYSNQYANKILQLNNKYQEYLNDTIKKAFYEELEKGNIKEDAIKLINSISATVDGLLLYSFILKNFDLNKEVKNYLNSLILMIKKD